MDRKVLIISNNCFSFSSNNGKTFESIFSGYKTENLSQLYFTDNYEPDFLFCRNYYRISDKDVIFSLFFWFRNTGKIISENMTFSEKGKSSSTKKFTSSNKISFIRFCRDMIWSPGTWKSNQLKKWSLDQNADYIFFVGGGSGFSHKVAVYLSEYLKLPLITFFTDDYILYPKKNHFFDYIQSFRIKRFYKTTISKSQLCFAIGHAMCKEYSQYFGRQFLPIMNSVPIALYSEKYSNGKNVSINYFGSLHTNRWKMIIKLAEIINDLNFDFVTLNVYSESVKDPDILNKFKLHGVNYMGSVYGDKLRSTICDSDILLHVENDDEYSKTLTKLSISTKIPEYLISGRPILAFGPQDIASMRFLEENNLAVVYYSSDNNNTKLKKLIEDSDFRKVLAKNAYDYAVKNFDNKKITSTFYSQIENVIGSN